jgi:hypothetical protein
VKQSLLVSALTLALLVLLSGSALATGKPVRVFIGGPLDVPVGSCPFPVTERITVNNEYILIFTGDHPAIITGSLRARITNDSTGKGIDVNISGPGFITANPDGTTTVKLAGRSTIFLPDRPGLWLTTGAATVVVGAAGQTLSLSLPNSAQDLCPVLAAL